MNKIINSILDTDLYKLTMMQVVFHRYKDVVVEYELVCRNKANLVCIVNDIKKQMDMLNDLSLSLSEKEYLKSLGYFEEDFLDYLLSFSFNSELVKIEVKDKDLVLKIKGLWLETILFEVPVLAIINETYFHQQARGKENLIEGERRLEEKINFLLTKSNNEIKNFKFCDFGTRRRFSVKWHEKVVVKLVEKLPNNFIGTSNVALAMKYSISPIGTLAHEYIQAFQVLSSDFQSHQTDAFEVWQQEYKNKLLIALTDTVGSSSFFECFNKSLAEKYEGLRHDSSDPFLWGNCALNFYNNHDIEAKNKTFVFSDSLNIKKAFEIYNYFDGKVKQVFGIGTNLSNDFSHTQLQIVIKLIKVNNKPVAKLSDDPAKSISSDHKYLDKLRKTFKSLEAYGKK